MSTAIVPANGEAAAVEENLNPFGAKKVATSAPAEVENQRAIAEIQAAMVIAQRFPRDEREAVDRILNAFTRKELCEKAMYEYARGGTDVSGLSIRAAEAIAQQWGNVQFGVREIEQHAGHSVVQSFCWDVQLNTRSEKTFQVEHVRDTRRGRYRLEDARDIYELVANQGARRLRACILALIPIDVQKAVERRIVHTLSTEIKVTKENVASMLSEFEELGVPKRAIEKLIQRNIESITPLQMARLGRIYTSIKDGIGPPADYFELEQPAQPTGDAAGRSRTDLLAERVAQKTNGSEAGAGNASPPNPEVEKPVAEKKHRTELRIEIDKAWNHVGSPIRKAVLTREYAKPTLLDLTTSQLEDFLARTPELLPKAPE